MITCLILEDQRRVGILDVVSLGWPRVARRTTYPRQADQQKVLLRRQGR